jgi:hypothetical protein
VAGCPLADTTLEKGSAGGSVLGRAYLTQSPHANREWN